MFLPRWLQEIAGREDSLFLLESERFERPDFASLLTAGLLGTLVMTAITYVGALVGLANLDIAGMLGAMLTGEAPRMFSSSWWAGMGWHFLNGSLLFPLVYGYFVLPAMGLAPTRARAIRGTVFGIALWFLMQSVVLPLMGGGFFSRNMLHPALVVFGSFLSHVGYGATLGSIARLRRARFIEITQKRAA